MDQEENLISILPKLQELEQKATKPDWYARETSLTEEVDRKYFSCMRIGSTVEDRVYMADIGKRIDLELTIDLRNAAPAMLAVLECFREGDIRCLKAIQGLVQAASGKETWSDELGCINRMLEAAFLMEDKGDE